MTRKLVVTSLCWLVIGVWIGATFLGATWERRFILYSVMRELKPGMPKSEAQAVVKRHHAPFVRHYERSDGIVLSVELWPVQYLELYMHFDQDRLVKAGIVGEDGPHDVPKDAPKFE